MNPEQWIAAEKRHMAGVLNRDMRRAAMEAFLEAVEMEPLATKPPRVMPVLDLPKPEYLHTIALTPPPIIRIKKTRSVGMTTFIGTRP